MAGRCNPKSEEVGAAVVPHVLARFLLALCLALGFGHVLLARAQTAEPASKNVAVKFDEYGSVGGCDHGARLDNLAIELQSKPDLNAYIVTYGPEGERSGGGKFLLEIIKDYLVNSRGIDASRLNTIYGGRNNNLTEPRTELWIAPPGAAPPEPVKRENNIDTFRGMFSEFEGWDSIAVGEGTGPPVGDVTTAAFVDMLQQQKQTRAYIVAYNGTGAATGAWRRISQLESERLQSHGLSPERLKVIYGGNGSDKETKLQLWILPADAPPPTKDAGAEPPPLKTVQIGNFNDYELGDARDERWAFKGFVDVLKSGKDLRACIVVRLGVLASEDDAEEASAAEVVDDTPDMPQPADLTKLVEKWRSELSGAHKIQPHRFVVLFVTQEKYLGNSLETWIVPAGAPLPDPNATHAEEEEPPASDNRDLPKKPN